MKYFKYIFWVLLVIVPCVITVLIYNDKITQNSPLYYKQGVKFYNEGNFSDAYYNFGKIKWISPLYPMALYKQAKSAQQIGDYNNAVLKYQAFLKEMPESVFSLKARLNLAKSYYYLKQYNEAKSEFEKIIQKIDNYGSEEAFFYGLIEKNFDKEKAGEYFRKYLQAAIDNSALDKTYILSSAQELANLGINLSNNDIKLIGTAYFKEHKYNEALNYFSKLPLYMCWDYFVLSNYYSGNKIIAKKLIEEGITANSENADEDNLHEIYNIYALSLPNSKIKNWEQIENFVTARNLKGNDYVLYKLADILPKSKAVGYYRQIYQNYPDSRYSAEALWNVIWYLYKTKDYTNAFDLAFYHLKKYKNVNSTPKVMFWLGKIYLKQNKINEANNIFNKLISKYPDNYYGLRAEAILNKDNGFWQTGKNNYLSDNNKIEFPITETEISLKNLKTINNLFNMGDYEVWIDADFSNPIIESWFELQKGKKSRSIVLARDEISKMEIKEPFTSAVYKLAYPVYMKDEISVSGEKLEIDPYLILAIIREESYFNEFARSSTGAIGLMQIMPQTANYMIDKLNVSDTINVEDARTNLYLGSYYLKYLKDRFNNDILVVAAYNGGEGAVNKWFKNFKGDDFDEFIEDIPYNETRNYVKKVFRTYKMYKKIYN